MEDFLKQLIKEAGGELAAKINEEESYVDTGSYVLNALVSGSIFGGISQNKITALAAPESCGKTFVALSVVKNFLNLNPDGYCLYFDTEFAVNKKMLKEKGIDDSRVVIINVVTIEEFRVKALKAVDLYLKTDEEKRKPCLFVLDSLGMLSTNKEITDTLAEKETRDMTKAQLTKGAFRMLTLKLGKAGIPMIVNNHLYDSMSMYSPKEMSSGSGLRYSASTILYISKSKEKDGTEVVGVILRFKTIKSRLSRENREVEVRLFYDERGLDRYYGLLPLAVEGGVVERTGNRYIFGDDKVFEKEIMKNPELFFTQEILERIDQYAQKKFKYGSGAADLFELDEQNEHDDVVDYGND
jgi:RecA/RadA recombinase